MQRFSRGQHTDPIMMAVAYLGANDKNEALQWLEKAHAEHSVATTTLGVDAIYDPLRDKPRFELLLRQMGLEQANKTAHAPN